MGLKNLWRRKARTFLTILGVIIGTASIVVMISMGIAMNVNFEKSLENMGSLNIIEVYPTGEYSYDEESDEMIRNSKQVYLTEKMVSKIKEIPYVDAVMPQMAYWGSLKAGRYRAHISLIGIDMSLLDEFGFEIEEGEKPAEFGKNQVIFGSTISSSFYNPRSRSRFGREVEVDLFKTRLTLLDDYNSDRGTILKTAGILKKSDTEKDWQAYMDVEDLQRIIKDQERKNRSNGETRRNDNDKNDYENVQVKVNDIDKIQGIQEEIQNMGFQAWSLSDILENMKKQSAGLRAVLGGIGAVSLFVAAIGITNTMVMSIYERTKEIGVMKVLGAELSDIKRLFLFESGIIGFLGGCLGLVLSFIIGYLLNNSNFNFMSGGMYWGDEAEQVMSVIPLWLSGASLGFATIVGVVSGYYPARRAMKLSALEAIRNE
jgi:ABC-type antimicrobial peptide transport system permease subunit